MINWENTKNPKLKGKAKDQEHFDRLNKLANGNLRQVPGVSQEAKDIVKKIKKETEK